MEIKNQVELNETILSSQVDFNQKLRFDAILNIFQDVTTMHSTLMGVSHDDMLKNSNAYWVLSKIKVKVQGEFRTGDEVLVKTWPLTPSVVRFNRGYEITKPNGEIVGHSEWCVLDAKTFRPRKFSTLSYPTMAHLEEKVSISDFMRFTEDFTEENFVLEHTNLFTDVDCNKHVNNVVYAKMALDVFGLEEFEEFNFNAFEIHFISQTFFGDKIKIYKKAYKDRVFVLGKKEEKPVFEALFYKE
ncbi:MAG: hypothetical protein IKC71_02300 [Clostridia bacterium]|nr:hypothetical protein [Clostridia bacterium]